MNTVKKRAAAGGTAKSRPPTLKNTYSQSPRIFEDIQKTLREHGARSITQDFDGQGKIAALSFVLAVGGRDLSFRLPARYQQVERIFVKQKGRPLSEQEQEQAYRTAWANIRDWIAAQMALIDTEMVEVSEVFLPYLVNPAGTTYFEALKSRQFLLEAPRKETGATRIQEEERNS